MRLAATTLLFAGAATAPALAAQPAAAATAINGELNIVANAYVDQNPTVTSSDSQNWTAVLANLNVSALAVANNGIFADHNERVSSFGSAQATWASANAGAVDFTNYRWTFAVKNPAPLDNGADLDANRPRQRPGLAVQHHSNRQRRDPDELRRDGNGLDGGPVRLVHRLHRRAELGRPGPQQPGRRPNHVGSLSGLRDVSPVRAGRFSAPEPDSY
ncbi:MAG TPA: hypothetical protein VFE10_03425 [Phenylobacterium sp.]|nr:hypothetical protein [Phenylobacterium sp.]